jgi:hypothetical protein
LTDPGTEGKIELIGQEAAAGAAILSKAIPPPYSLPLVLFSALEPILGPALVESFGALFRKIKGSKSPQAAAKAILDKAHPVADTQAYTDDTSLYAG